MPPRIPLPCRPLRAGLLMLGLVALSASAASTATAAAARRPRRPWPPTAACSRSMSPVSPGRRRSYCLTATAGRWPAGAPIVSALPCFATSPPAGLPPASARRERVCVLPDAAGAARYLSPTEHAGLQPAHPQFGLRLPDHPGRDPAGHRRASAARGGAGPVPDGRRVRGLRLRRSCRRPERIAQVAQALGFAVVDVNMRGTGCSGGAFDYFEALQGLDGYDVIETVAASPGCSGIASA